MFIKNTISKELDKYILKEITNSASFSSNISNENIYDIKLVARDNTTSKLYLYKNYLLNNNYSISLSNVFPISFINTFDKQFSTVDYLEANTDYIINFSYLINNFDTSTITISQRNSNFQQVLVVDFNKSYVKFTTGIKGQYDILFNITSKIKGVSNNFDIIIVKANLQNNTPIPIPISKMIVYSIDSSLNTTFAFITDEIVNFNSATINIKSSISNITISIISNIDNNPVITNVGPDVKSVYFTTRNTQAMKLSFTIKVTSTIPSNTTLRLSITIDSLDTFYSFSLDKKVINSNNNITYGYIELSYLNTY